jgi:hypothetical protein
MTSPRKTALVTGVFFMITIVASIPAAYFFYTPVLGHPSYITGPGADTRVSLGALLEVVTAIANIGTAVTLFPLLKRENEAVALGYVAARVVESVVIVVGILSLLAVVTLRQDLAGAPGTDAGSLAMAGESLVAVHDRTFLLGPGFLSGVGNGLMLGYLMYRSRLVPRRMAMLGLIGGPLVAISGIAVLLGLYDQVSPWSAVATLPEFAWEASLAVYLVVKGFRPSAVAGLDAASVMTRPAVGA